MAKLVIPGIESKKKIKRFGVGSEWDPIRALGISPTPGVPNFGVELEMGFNDASYHRHWNHDMYSCPFIPEEDKYLYEDDGSYFPAESIKEIYNRIEGFATLHEDCGALEIVSVPLPFDEIRMYLQTLLEGPIPHQAKPSPEEWGMHVHYSGQYMKGSHKNRVIKFLYRPSENSHVKFMEFIAGRSVQRGWGRLVYTAYQKINQDPYYDRDGTSFNTEHNTHEFRMFASTNDAFTACSNVEFVHALAEFTRPTGAEDYCEDNEEFVRFVVDEADEYPHLAKKFLGSKWTPE